MRIRTQDKREWVLPATFVARCGLLQSLQEMNPDGDVIDLEIAHYSPEALQVVLDMHEDHKDEPPLDGDLVTTRVVHGTTMKDNGGTEADDRRLESLLDTPERIFAALTIADFLDEQRLKYLLITMIALVATSSNVETLRKVFNVKGDLTAEEEEILFRQFGRIEELDELSRKETKARDVRASPPAAGPC